MCSRGSGAVWFVSVELRQLTYFEAVVRCGGFSRAAEQLHVAQPAISAQVKRLEAELGVVLLERTTRRIGLTHAGEVFLARARVVLDQLERGRDDLDALAVVRRGHLRIGATEALGRLDLPRSLAQFHDTYPGVTLNLRTGLIAELLTELDAGNLDVVVGPIHHDFPATYSCEPLVDENLVLLTPPDQRLAADTTTLGAVRDQQFVCLPVGSGLHTILRDAAAAEGFTRDRPGRTGSRSRTRTVTSTDRHYPRQRPCAKPSQRSLAAAARADLPGRLKRRVRSQDSITCADVDARVKVRGWW